METGVKRNKGEVSLEEVDLEFEAMVEGMFESEVEPELQPGAMVEERF